MSLLEVRQVTKAFGSLIAVREVSMRVEAGELRAVIGPNGAGKTTFFNMISGFYPPTKGEIEFDGRQIGRLSVAGLVALGLARTFQITEIFPELTVRANVRIAVESASGVRLRFWTGRRLSESLWERTETLLHQVGLSDHADRIASELSHGDQRAVEIAMALALNPKLLLLDEPTAGMGDEETYRITSLIRRLHRSSGLTIVLIEHDMRVVFHLADHLTVLDQGRLLAEGTPEEIAANDAVQAAYLGKTV